MQQNFPSKEALFKHHRRGSSTVSLLTATVAFEALSGKSFADIARARETSPATSTVAFQKAMERFILLAGVEFENGMQTHRYIRGLYQKSRVGHEDVDYWREFAKRYIESIPATPITSAPMVPGVCLLDQEIDVLEVSGVVCTILDRFFGIKTIRQLIEIENGRLGFFEKLGKIRLAQIHTALAKHGVTFKQPVEV